MLLQIMGSSKSPIAKKEVITIGHSEINTGPTVGKRSYIVMEIMGFLSISRKAAYELCNSGSFKVVRIGRSIRVSKTSFDAWLDNLSQNQEE